MKKLLVLTTLSLALFFAQTNVLAQTNPNVETSGINKSFLTDNVTVKTGSFGEIFYQPPVFKKLEKGIYELRGTIVDSKHKDTDPIPLSTITVSAEFYDKKSKDLILKLNPAKPDEKGLYVFLINNRTFNPNTFYDLKVSFDSTTGAHGEHTYSVNTGKGYIVPETGKEADNFFNKNSYRLLAPIPGMTALLDPELCKLKQQTNPGEICDVNAFLNFILSLIIGLASVVLVVRLIITGFGYMTTDLPLKKAKLKGDFREALIGLVVALSSYLILNTINPRLVNNNITIQSAEFEIKPYPSLDSSTYQSITGKPILPKSQYVTMAQNIAKEYGIDSCLLIATATAESGMSPAVFGSDADFAESATLKSPSRRAFINSGEKYSGATFNKGDDSLRTNKNFKNDAPKGVVDGRFSFGFGMLGITMFPEGYGTSAWEAGPSASLKTKPLIMDNFWPLNPKTNKKYTYTELLDAETSLRLGATLLKKKIQECGDPYKAMYAFNKGGCPSDSNGSSVRRTTYNQCKGI